MSFNSKQTTEDLGYAQVVDDTTSTKKTTRSRVKQSTKKTVTPVPDVVEDKSSLIVKINETGTVDLSSIEPEKLAALKTRAESLTEKNLLNLGSKSQSNMSGAADSFLEKVRATDVNVLGDTLLEMKSEIQKVDINKLKPMGPIKRFIYSLPGMNKFRFTALTLFEKYDDISGNIEKITTSLKQGQVDAIKDNASLDLMRQQTEANILDIEDELIVAEIKRQELIQEIEMMRANTEKYDAHDIADAQNFLDNLERRANDLNVTRVVMMQSLNDIRIIRQGNDVMVQKITSAIVNTLPIWKTTMALGVSLARQEMGVQKLNAFTDYSNEMLVKKSQMIKDNSIAIAKANERQVIDFETLKKCHTDMIETLNELEKIQVEGKKEREKNNQNIKALVVEMNNSLIDSNKPVSAIAAKDTKKK